MNFNYDNNELKIISNEVHIIENLLTNIFGLYAVQIGLPIDNFLQKSRIQNTYFFGENLISNPDLQTIKLDVIHSLDQFPLLSNSIDLVVLPHLLEIIPDNIKIEVIFEEIERVLISEGHIILSGFNPFSFAGCKRILQNKSIHSLWKIFDCLNGFNLQVIETKYVLQTDNLINRFNYFSCFGEIYIIHAIKRRFSGTKIPLKFPSLQHLKLGGIINKPKAI